MRYINCQLINILLYLKISTWNQHFNNIMHGVPQERRRTVNPLQGKTEFLANKILR